MIGSNNVGKVLVIGWNTFYYSWSPPIANIISTSESLQATFRILLYPLVGIIHSTAFIYNTIAPLSLTLASVLGFVFTGMLSIIYIMLPIYILKALFKIIKL
jgi:hypothetical protein